MTWLTWRQHRAEVFALTLTVAVISVVLVVLALPMHALSPDGDVAAWNEKIDVARIFTELLVPVPLVIGVFLGAPLLARELESGVLGNDAVAMGAVMAGGTALALAVLLSVVRPWRLAEISHALFGTPYQTPTSEQKLASIQAQIEGSVALYGERLGIRVVRKHIAAFVDAWCEDYGLPPMTEQRIALTVVYGEGHPMAALGGGIFAVGALPRSWTSVGEMPQAAVPASRVTMVRARRIFMSAVARR